MKVSYPPIEANLHTTVRPRSNQVVDELMMR